MGASGVAETDVAVIGGGLAGLTAAICLARRGLRVTIFEQSQQLGGRARTSERDGFRFNLGPHALYRDGPGMRVLGEVGIRPAGVRPGPSGWYAVHGGVLHTFPSGFVSLLTTGLLRLAAKLELARTLSSLAALSADGLSRVAVSQWVKCTVQDATARQLLHALVRLTTYTNDPERLTARVAVEQLRLSLSGGVSYLHGGWGTLVNALTIAAEASGVAIRRGTHVVAFDGEDAVRAIRCRDGAVHRVRAALVAASPAVVGDLLHTSVNRAWPVEWAPAWPVRVATLDLGLAHLPRPRATFALGIDQPLYASVHSIANGLVPRGGAVLQAMKYLETSSPRATTRDERELETLLDLFQPGWQAHLVTRRFLPALTVSYASMRATAEDQPERPGYRVPGVLGLYVAGDWVGPIGQLADASFASARAAAECLAADLATHTTTTRLARGHA